MQRITSILSAVALAAACGGGPEPMGSSDGGSDAGTGPDVGASDGAAPGPLEVLCDDVEARLAATGAPGWGIAIIEEGEIEILKAGGVADASEPEVPVTTATKFRTLALAELFTSIAALEAAHEGLIDLDAPVTDYFALEIAPAEWRGDIRVRDLIHQTSGLPSRVRPFAQGFGENIAACDGTGELTMAQWVDELREMEMGAPPGQFQIRDIVSPVVLAALLVAVEDRPFADIIQARVFDPAGMSGAYVGWRPDETLARGHEGSSGISAMPSDPEGLCEAHQPLNLAYASIDDLAQLARLLANGGRDAMGVQRFATATVDAVLDGLDAPSWVSGDLRAGAGLHPWPHEDGTVAASLSVGFGYGVGFAVSRDRRWATVVVRNESNSPFQEALAPILEARLGARIINRQYTPDPATWMPDAAVLAAIAGEYRNVADQELTIMVGPDGRLRADIPHLGVGGPLHPVLTDRFNAAIAGGAPVVRVFRDDVGAPEAIWAQFIDHPFWRTPPGPPTPAPSP